MALTKVSGTGLKDDCITSAHMSAVITNADIASNAAIALSKLGTSGTAGSGNFLRGDGAWTAIDLSGKLSLTGGTLTGQVNFDNGSNAGRDIQWQPASDRLAFFDNTKATFGDGVDLQIYHNGSHSYIDNGGTGSLYIRSNNTIALMDDSGDEMLAKFVDNAACELYYDNSKKFETLSNGVRVTGQVDVNGGGISLEDDRKLYCGTGEDFEIYHDGTNSIQFFDAQVGAVKFRTNIGNSARNNIVLGQGVELYHLNTKKFETISTGVQIYGDFQLQDAGGDTQAIYWDKSDYILKFKDNIHAEWGNGRDLKIYHNGTNDFIQSNGGYLKIQTDSLKIHDRSDDHPMIEALNNGVVNLYYDNSKKFNTNSAGVAVHGDISLGTDNYKIKFGTSEDLKIYHSGSHSFIDHTGTGNIHIRGNGTNATKLQAKQGEDSLTCLADGAVELYYDNSKKFHTYNGGVEVFGDCSLGDNNVLNIGTGSDLQIYHNGTNSLISNGTGELLIRAKTGENSINCNPDGSVELYHNNVKKFETSSAGTKSNIEGSNTMMEQYGVRAWVSFNGRSFGVKDSGNVSSVVDNGTGQWTVNFDTDFPDANYACGIAATGGDSSDTSLETLAFSYNTQPSAGSLKIVYAWVGSYTYKDSDYVSLIVVR